MKTFYTSHKLFLKLSLYYLFSFFSLISYSQRLLYNPDKDKYFLDSLKKITKKFESKKDFNYLQELKYFNSCIALGEYYEKLFHKKILSSNKPAVYYYEKVTDFGRFPDDPHYYKAAALRNNLCRKLAAIFFSGDGVKRNRKISIALALKGSAGYSWFSAYYSQKYFNCKCIFPEIYFDTGSAGSLVVNPFARQSELLAYRLRDNRLIVIGNNFKKRYNNDTSLNMVLTAYPFASMTSQALCSRLLENIKEFIIEKTDLPEKKIIIACNTYAGDPDTVDFNFKKR